MATGGWEGSVLGSLYPWVWSITHFKAYTRSLSYGDPGERRKVAKENDRQCNYCLI